MSTTAAGSGVSRAVRMCVALTVAGWITILALALPAGILSQPVQSPALEIQGTPVKAYPG
jgi:hypothetical protein